MSETGMQTTYTREDFLMSTAPFEELFELRDDPFIHQQALEEMTAAARAAGVIGFKKLYENYVKSVNKQRKTLYIGNTTMFDGQPIELDAGSWEADDGGIRKTEGLVQMVACPHPIMPVARLRNIDTGKVKLKLAFNRGGKWETVVANKVTLASASKVVELAEDNISVTSRTAPAFVEYISDMENLNYERLPEVKSVTRLGYIKGEGFLPYVKDIEFDGGRSYQEIYDSIGESGDISRWLEAINMVRQTSLAARIMVAASFASALVAPLGTLPFFVHLWGGTGNGKTVALMAAASIWADPEMGTYVKTFNATEAGFERLAAFLGNLPLCIDELQLIKNDRGKPTFNVYMLAQGAGKLRSTRTGGLDNTDHWANCFLTTGETPLTTFSSGGGEVNRVLDIDCSTVKYVTVDGQNITAALRKNYGFAGREFVRQLYDEGGIEYAEKIYKHVMGELAKTDSTEKQSIAAALIVTADILSCEWIFKDEPITPRDISAYLATQAQVSVGERAYSYLCDWAVQNMGKLRGDDSGDVYGIMDGNDTACIIRSVFDRACSDAGFDPRAVLSHFKQKGYIDAPEKGYAKTRRIIGIPTHCVWLKLSTDGK